MRQRGFALFVKRCFDTTVAVGVMGVTAPIMAMAMAAVLVSDGTPLFFRQRRPGRHGKPFTLYKFRTMSNAVGIPDAERVTRVGRFLRSTSIDELPQLINVLRGEMSLVGPRPLMMQYLRRYTDEQARRHDVMPGITGWTQINGRNALSWSEKFRLDTWYVDNWSLLLDLQILGATVKKVVRRDGISPTNEEIMPEFMGDSAEF